MQDHTIRRTGNGPRRRAAPNGRPRSGGDGSRPSGRPRRNANGNQLRGADGSRGEAARCIKCGHPAPDGKLCAFHRVLLNTFRKEMPEQDPRRFRF